MRATFGYENVLTFLDVLRSIIEKQKEQLKEQISSLESYDKIQEQLTVGIFHKGWREKSSKDIQAAFDKLEPITITEAKPDYDTFMQNITDEFADEVAFKDKMKKLGEEITDLKEFIMLKIQDDISIYNTKN